MCSAVPDSEQIRLNPYVQGLQNTGNLTVVYEEMCIWSLF